LFTGTLPVTFLLQDPQDNKPNPDLIDTHYQKNEKVNLKTEFPSKLDRAGSRYTAASISESDYSSK
jgi:hypothetical protein